MSNALNPETTARILKTLADPSYVPMRMSALITYINEDSEEAQDLALAIDALVEDGLVYITGRGRVCLPQSVGVYRGSFVGNPKGFGFVVQEGNTSEEEESNRPWEVRGRALGDIFVHIEDTNGAIHRDTVLCRLLNFPKGQDRAEGEIVKIIRRGTVNIPGTYLRPSRRSSEAARLPNRGYGLFVPDDKRMPQDVIVSREASMGATGGHKVVARLVGRTRPYEAEILEILGHPNDPGVDILSIVRAHEIPYEFAQAEMDEAAAIPDEVLPQEVQARADLRNLPTITIDGEDTKDIDDAISLERVEGGILRLGVHIADVTHYVKAGTALDIEARKRGTSVYLADRVIPMLPHKLSNGICSLNAECDRLALSCIMDIDETGDVLSHKIIESVIHVDLGTTYNNVQSFLDGEAPDKEIDKFAQMLRDMKALADILHKRRIKRGSIEFNFTESKIKLDENGAPIDVRAFERSTATNIIEEFMIAANEVVAEEHKMRSLPFVYRIHRKPSLEKMRALEASLTKLGYKLKTDTASGEVSPRSIAALMRLVEGAPEEAVISRMVLRSMQQAVYAHKNEGHFGLASRYYTHFTSPIRRYPDLMVHRLIKRFAGIERDALPHNLRPVRSMLRDICRSCSLSERRADVCAREVADMKKTQFMQDKIGEEFAGTISGATSWAIFVELENTVEGMVPPSSFSERMEFDEDRFAFVGRRRRYTLGDKVRIVVKDTDAVRNRVIFNIIED